MQLCDNQLAAGTLPTLRTVKPHLVVTIDVDDLTDTGTTGPGAARTGFGARISAARARWLACDASISRLVMGPDGLPLDVGREKRVVPPHLRRAVEQRDGHCVFTGCAAPTHWCDVHHLREWVADEGETSLDNSALLCERHHTKVHHGFRVERRPGGRWRTWRPDGTEIVIGTPLLV
ncbi:HNH endonuclease signature motif containing protein [Modestobacter versicolor]|uniref:HNH endonuclease signature motif containing protein n=1 Tax=Modestobacter versicolor TaxID=429133 RepID=UPI0034DF5D32